MNYSSKPGYVREAVGVFKDENDLEKALDELQESGFDRSEISLLANEKTVEERLGHYYEKTSEAADDPMRRALHTPPGKAWAPRKAP